MPIDTVQAVLIALILLLIILTLFGGVIKDVFPQLEGWGKTPGLKQYALANGVNNPVITCEKKGDFYEYGIKIDNFALSVGENADNSIKDFAVMTHFKGMAIFIPGESKISASERRMFNTNVFSEMEPSNKGDILSLTLWKYDGICFDDKIIALTEGATLLGVYDNIVPYSDFFQGCAKNYLDRFEFKVNVQGCGNVVTIPCSELSDKKQECLQRNDCYWSKNNKCEDCQSDTLCGDMSIEECGKKLCSNWAGIQKCYKKGDKCNQCSVSSGCSEFTGNPIGGDCEAYMCLYHQKIICTWTGNTCSPFSVPNQ